MGVVLRGAEAGEVTSGTRSPSRNANISRALLLVQDLLAPWRSASVPASTARRRASGVCVSAAMQLTYLGESLQDAEAHFAACRADTRSTPSAD